MQYCDLLDFWLKIFMNGLTNILKIPPFKQFYHFSWWMRGNFFFFILNHNLGWFSRYTICYLHYSLLWLTRHVIFLTWFLQISTFRSSLAFQNGLAKICIEAGQKRRFFFFIKQKLFFLFFLACSGEILIFFPEVAIFKIFLRRFFCKSQYCGTEVTNCVPKLFVSSLIRITRLYTPRCRTAGRCITLV